MKKIFLTLLFLTLSSNSNAINTQKVYFAGGCFWCMEESFDKVKGVIKTISGYSGGHIKNPKYKDVVKNTTGHYETLEITYDTTLINFLLYHKTDHRHQMDLHLPNISLVTYRS